MKNSKIRENLLNRLKSLLNFDKLKFVYLYGSVPRRESTERSDIDICLYYEEEKESLHEKLLKISGSLPDKYDVHMFQLLPLPIKKEVFSGDLLYAENRGFVHDLARETIKDYENFEPRYKYILRGKAGMEAKI